MVEEIKIGRLVSLIFCFVLLVPFGVNGQTEKGIRLYVTPLDSGDPEIKFENQWAFFIGINKYPYLKKQDINHAVSEASRLENLLIDKYSFFPTRKNWTHRFSRVEHLYNESASRDSIIARLNWYLNTLKEEDSLFIYFSGHGFVNNKGTGYWLPHDVGKDFRESRYMNMNNEAVIDNTEFKISYDTITNFLRHCQARHILVVVDACYAGFFKFKGAAPPYRLIVKKSRQLLAASMGEVPDPSPFSRFVYDFLEKNAEPYLVASKLISETMEKLKRRLAPVGGHILKAGSDEGEFVFRLSHFVEVTASRFEGYYEIAHDLLEKRKYAEAVYYYRKAIDDSPKYGSIYNDMGVAYERLGDYRNAADALKQAITLNPDTAESYYNLGYVYDEMEVYHEAIYYYGEAIRLKPGFADAFNAKGVAYFRLGDYLRASSAFQKAIQINPRHRNARHNLKKVNKKLRKMSKLFQGKEPQALMNRRRKHV